jgi:hypothetical protein
MDMTSHIVDAYPKRFAVLQWKLLNMLPLPSSCFRKSFAVRLCVPFSRESCQHF